MITSYDRAYWIGCSDTKYVMADNRTTKTWLNWYNVKLGLDDTAFSGNVYTRMGNVFEHPILKTINPKMKMDRQIKIDKYNLRANLDGDYKGHIYEVKTHSLLKPFEIIKPYYQQAQAEMFAWNLGYKEHERQRNDGILPNYHLFPYEPLEGLTIVSYGLNVEEYSRLESYERGELEVEIDPDRIRFHKVKYDRGFISQYKHNLKKLAKKIREGDAPW